MERRAIFFIVFLITLVSTLAVAVIGVITQQNWLYVALYSLATMWIVGVASQLLLQHLYRSVVRPTEEEARKKILAETARPYAADIDEIEEIDQAVQKQKREVEVVKATSQEEKKG